MKYFLVIACLCIAGSASAQDSTASPISGIHEVSHTDVPPQFPGGIEKFNAYLKANLHYPRKAKKNKAEGTVFVTFIVEKSGALQEVKILKGFFGACDQEALRLIRESPAWEPAKEDGVPIAHRMVWGVVFAPEDKKPTP